MYIFGERVFPQTEVARRARNEWDMSAYSRRTKTKESRRPQDPAGWPLTMGTRERGTKSRARWRACHTSRGDQEAPLDPGYDSTQTYDYYNYAGDAVAINAARETISLRHLSARGASLVFSLFAFIYIYFSSFFVFQFFIISR